MENEKAPLLELKGIGRLALEYKTTYKTMKKMLKKVPSLEVEHRHQRDFTPKEVEMIYKHLGVPGSEFEEQ